MTKLCRNCAHRTWAASTQSKRLNNGLYYCARTGNRLSEEEAKRGFPNSCPLPENYEYVKDTACPGCGVVEGGYHKNECPYALMTPAEIEEALRPTIGKDNQPPAADK